jgi:transcriptional regulator with XRE-family HTH domain
MIPHNELVKSTEFWMENIQDDLYARVKAYMSEKGINQTKLANELGVSRAYISQIMNGSFNFTLKKLIEISLHIGVFPNLKFIPFESGNNIKSKEPSYDRKENFLMEKSFLRHNEQVKSYQISEEFMGNTLNEGTP